MTNKLRVLGVTIRTAEKESEKVKVKEKEGKEKKLHETAVKGQERNVLR